MAVKWTLGLGRVAVSSCASLPKVDDASRRVVESARGVVALFVPLVILSLSATGCSESDATGATETATRSGDPKAIDGGADDNVVDSDDNDSDDDSDDNVAQDDDADDDGGSMGVEPDGPPTEDDDVPAPNDSATPNDGDPFADCEVSSATQSPDSCQFDRTCASGEFQTVGCQQLSEDVWRCSCGDWAASKAFELTSTTPPCESLAARCSDLPVPEFDEPAVCGAGMGGDEQRCELSTRCEQRVAIDRATTAIAVSRYDMTNCNLGNDAKWHCSCLTKDATFTYTVPQEAAAAGDACQAGRALCDGEELDAVGEWECTPVGTEPQNGCRVARNCTLSGEVGGIAVELEDSAGVTCEQNDAGRASCSCYTNRSGYADIDLDKDANDEATCDAAFDLCAAGLELNDDEMTCTVGASMAQPATCHANAECTRAASAGETEVVARGSIQARCQANGEGFSCRCASDEDPTEFAVDTDDSGEACATAALACPERVGAYFGVGILLPSFSMGVLAK